VHGEKPLAHNVYECRLMAKLAREKDVVTQLGIEHNASWQYVRAAELFRTGVIGEVREAHCGYFRSEGPKFPSHLKPGLLSESGRPKDTPPIPPGLDWDLWLGPALERPYHPAYCPYGWRAWRDFGTGTAGNFGCHIMDPAFTMLKLKYPTSVEAAGAPVPYERQPRASARFEFPARGQMPPVTLYWHEAGSGPPAELLEGEKGTCLLIGDKGRMLVRHRQDEADPVLLPKAKFRDVKLPEPKEQPWGGHLGRHFRDWTNCIRNGGKAATDFADYSGALGEAARLIHVAFYAGEKIEWDGDNMRITNLPGANQYVRREYRKGWEL
jgi:predicted dehydrogenase